ncbi:DUF3817 domain-containing protein [Leekyejoonella antrihumi]|uniref:DUF3817 domain-containing protein n=1 Tax=Leekyejoonella antrihumi TaxID=1660198 RepID=UPI001FEC593E|nr:DUF3817 domain-containing protein [Leekyejoonella antrihumi]
MKLDPRNVFRTIAFAEAVSWACLLIAMYIKYGPADNPTGVKIFGMIHGILFLSYLATVLFVRDRFRWSAKTLVLAALSAIPPFCTAVFEVLADRRGLLTESPTPSPEYASVDR